MHDREIIGKWIESINKEGRGLTGWEKQFMESVTDQFENGSGLSEKQQKTLEKIYVEKAP